MASGVANTALPQYVKASAIEEGLNMLKTGEKAVRFIKCGNDGAMKIAIMLRINKTCTALNLANNSIGVKGAQELSLVLEKNSSLAFLNLRFNELGDQGCAAIGKMLRDNTGLTSLDLWENNITAEGVKYLALGLKDNTILKTLNLVENSFGDDGANYFAQCLQYNKGLETVYLNGNNIGNEGVKALGKGLARNVCLKDLSLKGNKIGQEGASALIPYLRLNQHLVSLRLEHNVDSIHSNTLQEIRAILESHTIALYQLSGSKIRWTEAAWEKAASVEPFDKRLLKSAVESLIGGDYDADEVATVLNSSNSKGMTMVELLVNGECKNKAMITLLKVLVDCGFDLGQLSSDGDTKINELLRANSYVRESDWFKESSGFKTEDTFPIHESATSKVVAAYGVLSLEEVALKFMNDKERFLNETKVREQLREKGGSDYYIYIADADSSPTSSESCYLIMERGKGDAHTVATRENVASTNINVIREIALAAANALKFMNKHGIAHCDFTLSNLVRFAFNSDGESAEWKLVDLEHATRHGGKVAVPLNAKSPPEVAAAYVTGADLPAASEKMDVWGFGVALYELATGHSIIPTSSLTDQLSAAETLLLANWIGLTPDSMSKISWKNKFGNSTRDLVRRCLARDPKDRPSIATVCSHPFFMDGLKETTFTYPSHYFISSSTEGESIAKDLVLASVSLFSTCVCRRRADVTRHNSDVKQNVEAAETFLFILTKGVFNDEATTKELKWALNGNTKVIFIEKTAGDDAWVADTKLPDSLSSMKKKIKGLLANTIPYREKEYELNSMIKEVFRRSSLLFTGEEVTKTKINMRVLVIFSSDAATMCEVVRKGVDRYLEIDMATQWIEIGTTEEDIEYKDAVVLALITPSFFTDQAAQLAKMSKSGAKLPVIAVSAVSDSEHPKGHPFAKQLMPYRDPKTKGKEYESEAMFQEISRRINEASNTLE